MADPLDLVKNLKSVFTVKFKADKARIDNLIFQAHYRFTTTFFFVVCIFITAYTLIGHPIQCHNNDGGFELDVLNQFCWTMNTYTETKEDKHQLYPGVQDNYNPDDNRDHIYYQWVPFALFLHGLCFYLPHWLWKTFEDGKIKLMSDEIRGTSIADSETRRNKREQVVQYIISTLHSHKKYAYVYFACEVLNFINTILTMFIINKYLDNVFMTQGLRVFSQNSTLLDIFPRMSMCTFKKFGVTAGIQNHHALCVLPLNAINDKLYIFVWFWLLFLAIITFVGVSYSAAFLLFRDIRRMVIVNRFRFGNKYEVTELVRHIGVGDFLLLHLLGQNLSNVTFHQLLTDLNNRLLYPQGLEKKNPDGSGKPSSRSDNLYPTYFKTMDAMELDRVDVKEPLIRNDRMCDQLPNEKSVSAA